jgi:hypothetical protein
MIAAYHHWSHLSEVYGVNEAILICRFTAAHPSAFRALAKYNLDCDMQEFEAVDVYDDSDLLHEPQLLRRH